MRLIHFADIHLGFRQFQRLTPEGGGLNQREADVAHAFQRAIDRTVELRPDVVVIGGDVFHAVRPSNPAILHAFAQFARLARELPRAVIVIVAGNHDTPRAVETGCILRLFSPLGIHVVDSEARRLTFDDRELAILAVPDLPGARVPLEPDPSYRYNVLVLHGEVAGVLPERDNMGDRPAITYAAEEIGPARWTYVALGHYHVYRVLAPNACYSGSLEYTSPNVWGELREERAARIPGKGIVEFDFARGTRQFHPLRAARMLIDLPAIEARGMSAHDVDAAIRRNVEAVAARIDDKIVRQVVRDIPRHIARELDYRALREYKRRALHFNLDTRRPELIGPRRLQSDGRPATLANLLRDKLQGLVLASDVDRNALVEAGLRYLAEAETREQGALSAQADHA